MHKKDTKVWRGKGGRTLSKYECEQKRDQK